MGGCAENLSRLKQNTEDEDLVRSTRNLKLKTEYLKLKLFWVFSFESADGGRF